jgi:gas vesicle protein
MNNTVALVSAFLGGAAVGAAIALLTAPEKGEVTREKLIKALRHRGILAEEDEDVEVDELVSRLAAELDEE